MATKIVSARWTGEALNFVGTDTRGVQVAMGGENVTPGQMLLLALAGCTGMDVVSILQKKRQAVTGVEVEVTGYQPDDYPKPYHTVEVKYIVTGNNLDTQAVERAIELSVEKYCIVSQTLQQPVAMQTAFEVKSKLA
jgi:putative redox protein